VRELDVSPSVVRKWKRPFEHGSEVAVQANGDVVPAQQLRDAERRIRELERALGRTTMEVEILHAAQAEVRRDRAGTARPGHDEPPLEDDLFRAGGEPEHGVPADEAAAALLPQGRGRSGARADPHGDEEVRRLRAPPGRSTGVAPGHPGADTSALDNLGPSQRRRRGPRHKLVNGVKLYECSSSGRNDR
jgi:hypothetical protein